MRSAFKSPLSRRARRKKLKHYAWVTLAVVVGATLGNLLYINMHDYDLAVKQELAQTYSITDDVYVNTFNSHLSWYKDQQYCNGHFQDGRLVIYGCYSAPEPLK